MSIFLLSRFSFFWFGKLARQPAHQANFLVLLLILIKMTTLQISKWLVTEILNLQNSVLFGNLACF